MKRLLLGAVLFASLALIALDTRGVSIIIDPAALQFSPQEKAAFCGTTAPACPEVPVPPSPPSIPPPETCATNTTEVSWTNPQRGFSGRFASNGVWVVKFTTGNVASSAGNLPRITAAEWQSSPSTRIAALSDKPCDFEGLGMGTTTVSNSVTFVFSVETAGGFFIPTLARNKTYYLNVRNAAGSTCSISDVCDMFVDLIRPGGM